MAACLIDLKQSFRKPCCMLGDCAMQSKAADKNKVHTKIIDLSHLYSQSVISSDSYTIIVVVVVFIDKNVNMKYTI